jgi:hypothetical protein
MKPVCRTRGAVALPFRDGTSTDGVNYWMMISSSHHRIANPTQPYMTVGWPTFSGDCSTNNLNVPKTDHPPMITVR